MIQQESGAGPVIKFNLLLSLAKADQDAPI